MYYLHLGVAFSITHKNKILPVFLLLLAHGGWQRANNPVLKCWLDGSKIQFKIIQWRKRWSRILPIVHPPEKHTFCTPALCPCDSASASLLLCGALSLQPWLHCFPLPTLLPRSLSAWLSVLIIALPWELQGKVYSSLLSFFVTPTSTFSLWCHPSISSSSSSLFLTTSNVSLLLCILQRSSLLSSCIQSSETLVCLQVA